MSYPVLDITAYLDNAIYELKGADDEVGAAWSDSETGEQYPLPLAVQQAMGFWGKAATLLEEARSVLAGERVAEQARYDEDEAHWTR